MHNIVSRIAASYLRQNTPSHNQRQVIERKEAASKAIELALSKSDILIRRFKQSFPSDLGIQLEYSTKTLPPSPADASIEEIKEGSIRGEIRLSCSKGHQDLGSFTLNLVAQVAPQIAFWRNKETHVTGNSTPLQHFPDRIESLLESKFDLIRDNLRKTQSVSEMSDLNYVTKLIKSFRPPVGGAIFKVTADTIQNTPIWIVELTAEQDSSYAVNKHYWEMDYADPLYKFFKSKLESLGLHHLEVEVRDDGGVDVTGDPSRK